MTNAKGNDREPRRRRGAAARRGERRTGRRFVRAVLVLVLGYVALVFCGERVSRVGRVGGPGPRAADPLPGLGGAGSPYTATGATHVHSEYSHDAVGTTSELARAAKAQALDWALVTDHVADTSSPLPAPTYQDGVLLMFSQERALAGNMGRVIVQGIDSVLHFGSDAGELRELAASPGVHALITHPRSVTARQVWKLDDLGGAHAWEAFNLEDAVRGRLTTPAGVANVLGFLAGYPFGRGDESLLRTFAGGFERTGVAGFDSVYSREPITAVGSIDAHPKARLLGRLVPSYESMMGTVANHVQLSVPLSSDPTEASDSIWSAIKKGRVFVSFGHTAEARAFDLRLNDASGPVGGIGEVLTARPGLELVAVAPLDRVLYRLHHDGRSGPWFGGGSASWSITRPGAYRVEVWRYDARAGGFYWNLRPWIFANPVRVVPSIRQERAP